MTKAKGDMAMVAPEYEPRLYLDLPKADLDLLSELKVGKKARFVVSGKVVGLDQSETTDEKGKKTERGSIRLEAYRVKATGDNEFSDLAEEDD